MAVNGNLYDWESIEVQLPSGICIGITNIDYDDERPIEERYGKGNVPRGFGRKNYKASAKMELDLDEAERLRMALGAPCTTACRSRSSFPMPVRGSPSSPTSCRPARSPKRAPAASRAMTTSVPASWI